METFNIGDKVIVNGGSINRGVSECKLYVGVQAVVVEFVMSTGRTKVKCIDGECAWFKNDSLKKAIEPAPVRDSEEVLFIHKNSGIHFFGKVLHTTDTHFFVEVLTGEELFRRDEYKVFKEIY